MRIQHNIMAMNANRNLTMNNNALSSNLEKLSSGYKINRAGDDAAGLAISEKMRAQITNLDVSQDNAQAGINLVQTAEGALTEVHDMLNRMYELASQAANGTYSSTDQTKMQEEVTALKNEITRIANDTKFNGTKLLDGSLNVKIQVGDNSSTAIDIKVTTNVSTVASSITTIAGGNTTAKNVMGLISTAIGNISTVRSNLGAIQNRLEHTINNLAVTQENLQEAESSIRDTDVASEMMEYTKNNILIQSAQAMLAQANQVPQGVLQLLQ